MKHNIQFYFCEIHEENKREIMSAVCICDADFCWFASTLILIFLSYNMYFQNYFQL